MNDIIFNFYNFYNFYFGVVGVVDCGIWLLLIGKFGIVCVVDVLLDVAALLAEYVPPEQLVQDEDCCEDQVPAGHGWGASAEEGQ